MPSVGMRSVGSIHGLSEEGSARAAVFFDQSTARSCVSTRLTNSTVGLAAPAGNATARILAPYLPSSTRRAWPPSALHLLSSDFW
jgi:hypothetical protein